MPKARHAVDKQSGGTCRPPQGEGTYLIYIDLHLTSEVTTPQAFEGPSSPGAASPAGQDHRSSPDNQQSHPNRPPGVAASTTRYLRLQVDTLERTSGIRVPFSITSLETRASSMSSDPQGLFAARMTIRARDSHRPDAIARWATRSKPLASQPEVEHVLPLATQIADPGAGEDMLIKVEAASPPGGSPGRT